MVDPGSAAVAVGAANATTAVVMNAHKGAGALRRRLGLLGTFEPKWLALTSGTDFELTAAEVQDIHQFLSSTPMEPVLAFLTIAKLSRFHQGHDDALQTFATVFDNESDRWIALHKSTWRSKKSNLRRMLEELFDSTLERHAAAIGPDELGHYEDYINSPILNSSSSKASRQAGRHLTRLTEMMRDLTKLTQSLEKSREIAQIVSAAQHQPIINHTEVDNVPLFESLYIRRNFVAQNDDLIVPAETLDPAVSPFRSVIMGDPGAGKTTFVKHFKKEVSGLDSAVPVLEVVCRHYAKTAWDKSILHHAADILNVEYSFRVSVEELESMLLLGRLCLVFDGLDEITEQNKRTQMITRIESICTQYPVCSILVTTRLLGYERAPLPTPLFDHLLLDQFDDEQFEEYTRRWFEQRSRSDLCESFIRDSESVSDLRYNPLMLSLLCALYREHGSLPTDRRGVYWRCADLLFRRWDDHRQIEHAGAMPQYAERLMQEIARWVYNSPSVQDGIEDNQLIQILAHSLIDRDGFDPYQAERDATSFVEFCASRAWLLASFGTNHRGRRLFRFTHRTFLEYFYAESFVRRAASPRVVVDEIHRVYREDATSVVPELLIQSYELHSDGGGTAAFRLLLSDRSHNFLLLRMMEGIGMSATLREKSFLHVFSNWLSAGGANPAEFELVLCLNDQARGQLVRDFLSPGSGSDTDPFKQIFISAWAGFKLSGSFTRFEQYWQPVVSTLASELTDKGCLPDSQAVANWLVSQHVPQTRKWMGWDTIICPSDYGPVLGLSWWVIDARLGRRDELEHNAARDHAILASYEEIKRGATIPELLLGDLRIAIQRSGAEFLGWEPLTEKGPFDLELYWVLLYVLCALHEGEEDSEFLLQATGRVFGHRVHVLLDMRDYAVQRGRRAPTSSYGYDAQQFVEGLPIFLQEWLSNKRSFVLFAREL